MNSNLSQGEKRGTRKPSLTRERAIVFWACSACAGDYEDPDRTTESDADALDETTSERTKDFREPESGLRD
jgi:hypothetical protein